jgi:hypothetical protein
MLDWRSLRAAVFAVPLSPPPPLPAPRRAPCASSDCLWAHGAKGNRRGGKPCNKGREGGQTSDLPRRILLQGPRPASNTHLTAERSCTASIVQRQMHLRKSVGSRRPAHAVRVDANAASRVAAPSQWGTGVPDGVEVGPARSRGTGKGRSVGHYTDDQRLHSLAAVRLVPGETSADGDGDPSTAATRALTGAAADGCPVVVVAVRRRCRVVDRTLQ